MAFESKKEKKSLNPDDVNRELRDTMQETMMDLKLKTNSLLEKFKEQAKKDRVRM